MSVMFDSPPDVGTTVRLPASFTSLSDPATPIDPSAVTCISKDPDGVELTQTVIRDAVGEYHAEVFVPMAGQWRYKFLTTSPVRAIEGSFVVRRSEFVNYAPEEDGDILDGGTP